MIEDRAGPVCEEDFSQESIRKALQKKIFQHPVTLYGLVVGTLGGLSFSLLGGSVMIIYIAGGSLIISATSLVINYFGRKNHFINLYLNDLQKSFLQHEKKVRQEVLRDLAKYRKLKGAEKFVEQASLQFVKIEEKFNRLKEILDEKFNVSEITYGRYLGAAEQVYLSALDNLTNILPVLKSLEGIDVDCVSKQLKKADSEESKTLTERINLYQKQLDNVESLITNNEELITALDEVTVAIATVQTHQGVADVGMEEAKNQLKELARRAKNYSINNERKDQ
jgi:hypothetical protein